MKCPKCGVEIGDDSRFCAQCGAKIRECPNCGFKSEPNARFCKECGYSFPADGTPGTTRKASVSFGNDNMVVGDVHISAEPNGSGNADSATADSVSIGNENDIAGDVHITSIGKQENIHVEGGGTFVKNEDETKKLARCHVCNGNRAVADGFTCRGCGRFTCKDCYDRDLKRCETCKETDYGKAFQVARENGMKVLSPEQIRELGTKYRIKPDRAAELRLEVVQTIQKMQNGAECRRDDDSDVEFKLFAEGNIMDAYAILQGEARIDPFNAEALARRLYAALKIASVQNENDLPAVPNEAQKEKTSKARNGWRSPDRNVSAESAAEDADQIVELAFIPGNDTPGIYLVLIDQTLEGQSFPESVGKTLEKMFDANATQDLLVFANRLLDRAERLWPGNVLLKCRRITYFMKLFEQTRLPKCRMEAEELLKSLPMDSPSVMERSWLAKVRGLMQGGKFDPTPQYCEENGGLYFFVLTPWSSESYYKKAKFILSGNEKTLSPYDRKHYFQLLETAATKFSSPSSEILTKYADCLANGFGTDHQDTKTALEFYRKAAEADGITIMIEGTVFKSYQDHGTHTEYAVPNGITKIANGAFAEARLTKVTIPLSVSEVEEDFSPSCAVSFVGDSAVEATSFEFDGCVFSVPEITGIRTALHSFSRKVRDAEDRVSWCNPSITPNCDRKCGSCLLCLEKGIAAQRILAFLSFAMEFCEEHGIWISKPNTPNSTDAAFALAEEYAHRKSGKTEDVSKAVVWYRDAAEGGHAKAQFLFAECCFDGAGISEDKVEAVKWYRKAAEQGVAEAQLKLAGCCFDGIGLQEDKAEAFRWYRKAIESIPSTDARSMYQIGECFFHGWGTKQDYSEAVQWYRKAAEQGLGAAQFELAGCCIDGFGMKQDKIKAFEWYRRADEKGITDARAQMILGEGYFNAGDFDKALLSYRKATAGEGNCFFADYTPRLLLEHITEISAKCPTDNIKNRTVEILRDVFRKTENRSDLDSNNWVSLLTLTDGISLEHCDWECFTGKNWVELLSIKPEYAEYCGLTVHSQKTYWTRIIDDQLKALADKQPEFRFIYDLRTGGNVAGYLRDHPEMIRFCNWIRVSRQEWIELLRNVELTRRLVKSDPDILSKYCPWDYFNDEDRVYLLSICPEYSCHCKKSLSFEGWGRILRNAELTRHLVKSDPEFLASCPWNDFTGNLWSDLLSLHPEYESYYKRPPKSFYHRLYRDNAPICEPIRARGCSFPGRYSDDVPISVMKRYVISKDGWLRILKSDAADRYLSHPESSSVTSNDAGRKGVEALLASCPWEIFAWEDWVSLLSVRPDYVRFFKWEDFKKEDFRPLRNIGDRLLAYVDVDHLPFIAISKMEWGKYRDWSRVTTGKEWCDILKEYPAFGEFCDWDLLEGRDWANLLSDISTFKEKCLWFKFNKDDWGTLLDKQPDMISFFPCDLHAILHYPYYYFRDEKVWSSVVDKKGKRNDICRCLARKFSFIAVCACMLVFAIISLWGDAGWCALFSESRKHALAAGAIWFVATILCAILHARIWGDFFLPRCLNLGHAFFVSFSFFTIYHWSFFFSRYSFCLILCGGLLFLLFILPVVGRFFDLEVKCLSFFMIPYFCVFSWFLLSPVGWSNSLIFLVILLFVVICVLGWFAGGNSKSSLVDMDDITLSGIAVWLVPSLIIGVWSLLMPINPHACYRMADSLQISFPSASQALYRKGQAADPDFSRMEREIPGKQKNNEF